MQSESTNSLLHEFSSKDKDIINKAGVKLKDQIKETLGNITHLIQ